MYPKMTALEAAQHVIRTATTPAAREMQREGKTGIYIALPEWDDSDWTDEDFVTFSVEVQRLAQSM